MTFDLKKFKDQGMGDGGYRPCLFNVVIDNNEKLSYLIFKGESGGGSSYINNPKLFYAYETEEFTTAKALKEIIAKLDADKPVIIGQGQTKKEAKPVYMKINFFKKDGSVAYTQTQKIHSLEYKMILDWGDVLNLGTYEIKIYSSEHSE